MRLKDKVAIITGGSRGIGFATADKFLKEGATVVLAASSKESADTAVDKLKEKYPNAIVAGISPNLASMEAVRKAFKEAIEKYGCVDILVNNAGISENTSFMDYTEAVSYTHLASPLMDCVRSSRNSFRWRSTMHFFFFVDVNVTASKLF